MNKGFGDCAVPFFTFDILQVALRSCESLLMSSGSRRVSMVASVKPGSFLEFLIETNHV